MSFKMSVTGHYQTVDIFRINMLATFKEKAI